jgi:glycosyltransferase involved in cell wall biosynthesis
MITWVYTVAYNEQDLLPFWLRHYQTIADKIIIYDHQSTDRTREIASAHPLVELRDYTVHPQMDDDSLTDFANTQYKEAVGLADWVIWCDVDEFVMVNRDILFAYWLDDVAIPILDGYTMIADSFPQDDGRQLYEHCRDGIPDELYSKSAIFAPKVNINYTPGKHRVYPTGGPWRRSNSLTIPLLHYRYFGPEWLAARNAKNYGRISERNLIKNQGWHASPDNHGLYSLEWFAAQQPERVI